MDDEEYEEVELDDGEPDEEYFEDLVSRFARKNNKWIVFSAVFEMLEHVCDAVAIFFETLKHSSSQRYLWEHQRQEWFETASMELETIDASAAESGSGERSGSPEQKD